MDASPLNTVCESGRIASSPPSAPTPLPNVLTRSSACDGCKSRSFVSAAAPRSVRAMRADAGFLGLRGGGT